MVLKIIEKKGKDLNLEISNIVNLVQIAAAAGNK